MAQRTKTSKHDIRDKERQFEKRFVLFPFFLLCFNFPRCICWYTVCVMLPTTVPYTTRPRITLCVRMCHSIFTRPANYWLPAISCIACVPAFVCQANIFAVKQMPHDHGQYHFEIDDFHYHTTLCATCHFWNTKFGVVEQGAEQMFTTPTLPTRPTPPHHS